MPKLPAYLNVSGARIVDNRFELSVKLNAKHPALWRELWYWLDIKPRWLKPIAWVWMIWRLGRG